MESVVGTRSRDFEAGYRVSFPTHTPKMIYPLVMELAVAGIPVAVTWRVLKFSKQAFYKWKAQPMSDRQRWVTKE